MSRYLSRRFDGLEEYIPGEQPQDRTYIKLNTNESPYPPSPGVLAAVNTAEVARLNLYSDPDARILTQALAAQYGVEPEHVFLSNGSDDILNFCFLAFCDGGAMFPEVTYGFYPVYAALHGVAYETPPLRPDLSIDPADYCSAGRTVVLANPNAQTGLALPLSDIERIVQSNPDHVMVIDEAYVDFGAESAVELTRQYDNLLVVQTFSKSRSLAGARLGFAIGPAALIADLNRLKFSTNPYNLNRLTQLAGAAALAEQAYYDENCRRIRETRARTRQALLDLGFTCTDSRANFLLASSPAIPGGELYRRLKDRGVLVRHFTDPKIENHVRITIGAPDEMEALLAAVRAILG
ncbi:MAG: histidinol-phosphate transaminase [Oscillospiraceae bacterium]|nr:histidinol-phosphate transaminase [Oscillospiraceae bacterium]